LDSRHERETDAGKCAESVEVLTLRFMPHEQPPLMPEPCEPCPEGTRLHRPALPVFLGVLLDRTPLAPLPVLRSALGRNAGEDAPRAQRLPELPAAVALVGNSLPQANRIAPVQNDQRVRSKSKSPVSVKGYGALCSWIVQVIYRGAHRRYWVTPS
jgi:hypothetical protein